MKAKKVLECLQNVMDGKTEELSDKQKDIDIVCDLIDVFDQLNEQTEQIHSLSTDNDLYKIGKQQMDAQIRELKHELNAEKTRVADLHQKLSTKDEDEARELAEARGDAESSRKRISDLKRQIYELNKENENRKREAESRQIALAKGVSEEDIAEMDSIITEANQQIAKSKLHDIALSEYGRAIHELHIIGQMMTVADESQMLPWDGKENPIAVKVAQKMAEFNKLHKKYGELIRQVSKAVADEREECAKLAESFCEVAIQGGAIVCTSDTQNKIAAAIRNRF